MSTCVSAVSNGLRKLWTPPVFQVRFRFHKDKIEAGPLKRRYGYTEQAISKGLLPHVKHEKHIPGRQFIPADNWTPKKALFGQNDYIDIFTGRIHPTKVLYDVPAYLRGFKGNEFQCLMRKQKMQKHGEIPWKYPSTWRDMNKRIGWLYRYLNRHTRTWSVYRSRMNS
ncbi:hypothetical protein FOCC_FOCC008462 [Frankliniella occidentalis]|uniref:Large ribosomal subunit protein mL51 n=1 Tax=Frankliniella occidentalis TaxID=133901 RepID=A0A6J1S7V4_FRAOC|nr:39S ribosomal protein L51, mitochondrial [Frankliniella occidentalis]XP_026275315.1 39S ribosomal protein L51, mitochondrial [Frankliniella occidentalis]XP_052125337.1 39S ribosomal protein L51, mitochondrial-like [Frankliniella occidentalis]KAE8744897.1 hypothetical protein FOCC_FOCC008462 [Frankliniella occidentalis]